MAEQMATVNKCKCPHHKIIPVLIIVFALVFLLGALDVVSSRFVSISWPILLGLAGVFKLVERKCTCC